MIKQEIDKILNIYYNEADEYYIRIRYNNEGHEFYIDDEMQELLRREKVEFKIEVVHRYSDFAGVGELLTVSWVESDKIYIYKILVEQHWVN